MIEIVGLNYCCPDGSPVLRNVNLTVADGEFMLICGPNGSGKTTLIRHMNGLLKPSSGSVLVNGVDAARSPREAMQRVGMVFQDADSQIVGETVREDVAFGPENLGLPPEEVEERVTSALTMTGLVKLADKPCHFLSGGEKRRVAIAGALAMKPEILVLDEPFANLDYLGVRQVLEEIVKLRGSGCTLVATTHDVEKAAAHVDRIAIIYDGEIKGVGTVEEMIPELPAYHVRPPCYSLLGGRMLSWLPD